MQGSVDHLDALVTHLTKSVQATRVSCQETVNAVIPVVNEFKIITTGVGIESVPDFPFSSRADCGLTFLLDFLNGRDVDPGPGMESWLRWFKWNTLAYVTAMNQPDPQDLEAQRIAEQWEYYLVTIWDYCNQIARHASRCDGEAIYRTLNWPSLSVAPVFPPL